MTRDGFAVVDHDPGFLRDVKLRRLRRNAPDEGEGAIRTLLYLALRDECWADGVRLVAEDADSPYEPTPERIAALVAVGLLADDHRLPDGAWGNWFGAAVERRQMHRINGAAGGRETAKRRRERSDAAAPPERGSSDRAASSRERSSNDERLERESDRPVRRPLRADGPPRSLADIMKETIDRRPS